MSAVHILNIEEAGSDYILMKDATTTVRVKFADDHQFPREDSAALPQPNGEEKANMLLSGS